MKRLIFITPSLDGGGAERRVVNLAILFSKKGYDVTIIGYTKVNVFTKQLEDAGVNVVWRTGGYLQRLIRIPWYIITKNFDASISLLPTPCFLNNIASFFNKGKRIVITGESSCNSEYYCTRRGKFYSWFRRFSDYIVCNSERAKEMWEAHFPQYEDKLTVIYNPVILPKIDSTYSHKEDGKLHIVIASSVYKLKNPIGVIESLCLMDSEERSTIHIDWYGRKSTTKTNGDDYIKAVNMIKNNHLEDVIIFHDSTPDIIDRMNNADVVALFSQLEGLPNAICEGMMLGKPIIMTRMSDYEILVDATNGILCDWDNPKTIKGALLQMARKTDDEHNRMGEASKKKAELLFDSDKVVKKWIEMIETKN